jgi:hypothetical protein
VLKERHNVVTAGAESGEVTLTFCHEHRPESDLSEDTEVHGMTSKSTIRNVM